MDTPNKIRNLLLKVVDREIREKENNLLSSPKQKIEDEEYCISFIKSFSSNSIETTPSSGNIESCVRTTHSCKTCTIDNLSNSKTYLKVVCSLFKKSKKIHVKKTQSCKFNMQKISQEDKEAFLLRTNSKKYNGKSSFFEKKTYSAVNTSLSESN